MKNIPVGEVLKEYGYITEAQLQEALSLQKQNRQKRLGELLISMGAITEAQLLSALGQKLGLELLDLPTFPVEQDAVIRIPRQIAVKYTLIAVSQKNGKLTVAMNDPLDFYAIEDVRLLCNMQVEVGLSPKGEIVKAIQYYYAEAEARIAAAEASQAAPAEEVLDLARQVDLSEDSQAPVVKLLNSLLIRGYKTSASDIHIEPYEEETLVRMRIDGQLIDYVTLPASLQQPLLARAKIISGMDIAEKRVPQDGHFKTTVEGVELNVRSNVIPTIYGEKCVLRFLNSAAVISHGDTFGMDEENYQKTVEILKNPHGILYITGPTGSGKTTTLYMILERMVQKQINIVTIEDPVEKSLPRVNHMQVNPQAGLTFESGLRAILRQDPDIIMVGETRDSQTAEISVRAAITGHLVLSTLHTNDAVSAIVRMEDMGVEAYMVSNTLVGVIAQRLVKKICPNCREEVPATDEDRKLLGRDVKTLSRGKGCHLCNNTGYKGRLAIHEVIVLDQQMRRMISQRTPIEDIYRYVREEQGIRTLRDNATQLVLDGVTDVEEMIRLTYGTN